MTNATAAPERISILHIITTFSLGGATENTLFSAEGLQAKGYDVWILAGPGNASEGDLLERAREKGIRVAILPDLMRNIHPWKDVVALIRLVRILKRERVRIVHTHSSKAGILGRIAAFIAGVPIIVHTIHGLPFHDYQGKAAFTVFRLAEQLCALVSDKLITVTDTIREKALAARVGKPSQFVTVRSGFEMEEYLRTREDGEKLRREFGFDPSDLIVGKIARCSPLKGHRYLIDAIPTIVRRVPAAKFFFVGGGEEERELRDLVKAGGMESAVVFGGLLPPSRIPEVLSIMDVVVHTSLLEGLARVLPQALASQKPVVSFDIDGAREVVLHDTTGLLVPPENIELLSESIIELLQDRQKAIRFGRAGRDLVQNRWTVGAMVRDLEKVYLKLMNEHPG